ncbi:MAG TPA: PfkB family carbohydrate kinase [Rhizobiaceae bacterium]|nr:PfkB family carbohydrate kinase [Rhizobiaceae bacterium]
MADSLCFVTGAHIDLTARIFAPAVLHASNPGTVTARPGGAGLNSASTAASLGASAVMASPVGPDAHGENLRQTLTARGIADALVTVEGLRTGTYTAIIEPDGSMLIGLADLAIYESIDANWFFKNCATALETSGLWFLNANLPAETLAALVGQAEGRKIAAATISPAKAPRLAPILRQTDFLFTNAGEARALTGLKNAAPAELARSLAASGVRSGTISSGAGPLLWWHGRDAGIITPPPVDGIVDVNGAGDALAATILAGLDLGLDFRRAAELGVHAAQMTLASAEPWCENLSWSALEIRAGRLPALMEPLT